MLRRFPGPWLAVAAIAAGLMTRPVMAQCAMCGQGAQAAADPSTVAWTFGAAVLILLVPAQLVLAGVALLIWTARRWDGALAGSPPDNADE